MTTLRSRGLGSGKSSCPLSLLCGHLRALRAQLPTITVAMETSCAQVEPTVAPITFTWSLPPPLGCSEPAQHS